MTTSAVRAELLRLQTEHGTGLKPEHVLNAARDPESVLHGQFEWDDSVAAEKHRLSQARDLIVIIIERPVVRENLTVLISERPAMREVRLFSSPNREGYLLTTDVYLDSGHTVKMLDTLRKEVEALAKRLADQAYAARTVGNLGAADTLDRLSNDLVDASARAFPPAPTPTADNGREVSGAPV